MTDLDRIVNKLDRIADDFDALLVLFQPKGQMAFSVGRPSPKETSMLEVSITNEEKIPIIVTPTTSTGKPADIDGSISVTVQSGEGTFELEDDGKTFFAVSGDNPGDTVYLVEADADLGAGVQTISAIVTAHVAHALAANLGLSAGAPVPK